MARITNKDKALIWALKETSEEDVAAMLSFASESYKKKILKGLSPKGKSMIASAKFFCTEEKSKKLRENFNALWEKIEKEYYKDQA